MANRKIPKALVQSRFPWFPFLRKQSTAQETMMKVLQSATARIWLQNGVHFLKTLRVTIQRGIYCSCKLNNSYSVLFFFCNIVCVMLNNDLRRAMFLAETKPKRTTTGRALEGGGGVAVGATGYKHAKTATTDKGETVPLHHLEKYYFFKT